MRDKRRPRFYVQRLQFLVPGTWDQRFIERIDHLLVVGDFVIDTMPGRCAQTLTLCSPLYSALQVTSPGLKC